MNMRVTQWSRSTATVLLLLAACKATPPASSTAATPPAASEPAAPAAPAEPHAVVHLRGQVLLPGGATLAYAAVLQPEGGTDRYAGTLDIPAQSVAGARLDDVEYEPGVRVKFSLPVPGTATWQGAFEPSGEITCKFSQGPMNAECTMQTISAEAFAATQQTQVRPQTPQPPFPYGAREVSYRNETAGITIAGTLTIPEGDGPHPAALLITGSGAQDRDETIFGHKPFAVIADALTRAGVAVLRVDDRGIGGTDAGPAGATSADFADDVRAGVAFLRTQADIDGARIGLIGHSEGGLIAPIVAADRREVAFVVLLAGPGVTGAKVLEKQVQRIALAQGLPAAQAEAQAEDQRTLMAIVMSESDPEARRAQVREVLQRQTQQAETPAPTEEQLDAVIGALDGPWFRAFMKLDPAPYLRRVRCPVLVLNGELDVQVDADQNVPAIERALRKGGNKKVTVARLPGLNHLFQPAATGAVAEYAQIEQTFDPAALTLLTEWVVRTTQRSH